MPPYKFEANPTLRLPVNALLFLCFRMRNSAYAIIYFLTDRLVFLNTVTYIPSNTGLFKFRTLYVTVPDKRDHFRQYFKIELLVLKGGVALKQ